MSTYDLEEQEQLAALKAWWKEHGGAILLGATLVLAAIAAWNGWMWYQRSQSAQAAVLYDTLQKAARANDLKTTRETAGAILENFPRSAYAPLAALVSAKVQFQAGDLKTARAQLQWVIEHAGKAKPHPGFEALYASQRGDVLATQKRRSEARASYKAALEKAEAGALRDTLRLKLEALGDG